MEHRFVVVHFGGQCPWLPWVLEQARLAAAELGGTATAVDVSAEPQLAERYRLFFPFLTVVDDDIRISAPTPAARLVAAVRASLSPDLKSAPGLPESEPEPGLPVVDAVPERVEPLMAERVADTCTLCGGPPGGGCKLKTDWAGVEASAAPAGLLGFVAYVADEPVAAVEYLPAVRVPYPLPVSRDGAAFITCIYPTRVPDYRGAALERLLAELPRLGFRRALVVAGRRTPFPNGPVEFFRRHGFREMCTLMSERLRDTNEELVLMERTV